MEEISCIFCGRSSDDVAIEENGYLGRRCPSCRLIYISPRPTRAEVVNLYDHDQAHISADRHRGAEHLKRYHAGHVLSILRRFRTSGTLLDIGAGAGHFVDEARKAGFSPRAIELNPAQADFIEQDFGIPCERTPLNEGSFGDSRFDVIYHCDTLSHLHDPIADLRTMRAKLKSDGVMVFQTGNFADVEPRFLRWIDVFQYPDHLFFFGEGSLDRLLTVSGFERVATYRYSNVPQQLLYRFVAYLRTLFGSGSIESRTAGSDGEQASRPAASSNDSTLTRLLKRPYHYLIFAARHRLGALVPRTGRPQSLLIVARPVG